MTIALFFKLLPWGLFALTSGISALIIWIKNLKIKSLKNKNAEIFINKSKKEKEIAVKIKLNTQKMEEKIINAKDKIDSRIIINDMSSRIVSFFDENNTD